MRENVPPELSLTETHIGALSHCPPEALKRISTQTSTPISSLSTLAVQNRTASLYTAILAYAGVCSPPGYYVDSFEEPEGSNSSSGSDSDYWFRPSHRAQRIKGKQNTIPPPKYYFGLGETDVLWPPQKHLTARSITERLQRERRERKEQKRTDRTNDVAVESIEVNNIGSHDEQNAETRNKIYLVHYSCGQPLGVWGDLVTLREILVVSPDGEEVVKRFAHEVVEWHQELEGREAGEKKFRLYRFILDSCGDAGRWKSEGLKRARPSSSIFLKDNMGSEILSDLEQFLHPETRRWYTNHGLPYRRSLLFFGPPGTGKTSTIKMLAAQFGLSCCFLSMTSNKFSNQHLGDALSKLWSRALIVLEDVDALFTKDRQCTTGESLTFSGLLNALDGVCSVDGVVTIMTTNHLEKLDKALIRGGRVDRRFYFGLPTSQQLEDMFASFYPNAPRELAQQFARNVEESSEVREKRSIATLQQLFVTNRRKSAQECLNALPEFFETHFPDESQLKEEQGQTEQKDEKEKNEESKKPDAETPKPKSGKTKCESCSC